MPQQNKRTVKTYYRLSSDDKKRLMAPSAPMNNADSVSPSLKVKNSGKPAENNNTALKKKKTIIIAAAVVVIIGIIIIASVNSSSAPSGTFDSHNETVSSTTDNTSSESTSHSMSTSSTVTDSTSSSMFQRIDTSFPSVPTVGVSSFEFSSFKSIR